MLPSAPNRMRDSLSVLSAFEAGGMNPVATPHVSTASLLSAGYGSLDSSTRSASLSTTEPSSESGSPKDLLPSNGSDSSEAATICFDFTKGMCTRGDKCKYSHDIETIIEFNSKEKGICFDHLRNQCHRGVLCRFSHDLSSIAMQCQDFAAMPHTKARPTSICYDFVKGTCARGVDCRYSHDLGLIARSTRAGAGQSPHAGMENPFFDALGPVNPALGFNPLAAAAAAAAAANPLLNPMAMASLGALQGQLAGHQAGALAAGLMGNPAAHLATAAGLGAGAMNGMLNPDLMAAAGGSNLALLAAMQAKTMQAAMQARNAAMLSGAGAAAAAGSGLPEAGFGTPGVSPTCSDAALAQLLAQRELTRNMAMQRAEGLYNGSTAGSLPGLGMYPPMRHSDSGANGILNGTGRRTGPMGGPAGGPPPFVGGMRHSDSGAMPSSYPGAAGRNNLAGFDMMRPPAGLPVPPMGGKMGGPLPGGGLIRAGSGSSGGATSPDTLELLLKQQALQQAAALARSEGLDLEAGMGAHLPLVSAPLGMLGGDPLGGPLTPGCNNLLGTDTPTHAPTQIRAIWDRA